MRRHITGFHQDDEGDWVADLDCLHAQHVRHEPPFQQRPWVTTEAGRADRIGSTLDCPPCDRGELPSGLQFARTLGPLDQTTVPAGLRRTHRLARATWAELRVLEGSLAFRIESEPPAEHHLTAGDTVGIPPEVEHVVLLDGPARLEIDFFRHD